MKLENVWKNSFFGRLQLYDPFLDRLGADRMSNVKGNRRLKAGRVQFLRNGRLHHQRRRRMRFTLYFPCLQHARRTALSFW